MQEYRAQIKNFLDTHKPYFMFEDDAYFIEDIASYHIHAGEYLRKDRPAGAHSNYGGNKLTHFDFELLKEGPLGAKDVILRNSRFKYQEKPSSIYPEAWSEFLCDLKAIEVVMSNEAEFSADLSKGIINITGYTSEGLRIQVGYDIKAKRIKTHYPKFDI